MWFALIFEFLHNITSEESLIWQVYIVFQSSSWQQGQFRWYQIFSDVLIYFVARKVFSQVLTVTLAFNIPAMITNTHKNYELSFRRLIWFVLKNSKVFSCFFSIWSLIWRASRLELQSDTTEEERWRSGGEEKEYYFDAAFHKHVTLGPVQMWAQVWSWYH